MRRTICGLIVLLATTPACVVQDTSEDAGFRPGNDVGGGDVRVDDTGTTDTARADATTDAGTADAGTDASDTQPDPRPVDERGRYEVGYTEIDVSYQADEDRSDEPRDLTISIWYPTRVEEGPAPQYTPFLKRDQVVRNAEPADLDDMPVMVFSHGNGGIRQQNYFMTEHWASHGWTVVSPEHDGNTLSDGTAINVEAAVYRPQDIRAVLDRLEQLDDDHPLAGRLSDDIVMSGHSFGGYTTLANAGASYAVDELLDKCEQGTVNQDYCDTFTTGDRIDLFRGGFLDERIDLAIPLAPAGNLIFSDGLQDLTVPTMLFTAGRDQTLPNDEEGDPIWRKMVGPEHRRLNLPEAGHFTFSNMCDFGFADDQPRLANDGCSDDFVDPARAYTLVNTYGLAFARYHLFDDQEAGEIVDGERFPVGDSDFEMSVGTD